MNVKLVGLLGATLALAPFGIAQAMPVVSSPVAGSATSTDGAILEKTGYYDHDRGWHRDHGWHHGWHRPWGWHRHWHHHDY